MNDPQVETAQPNDCPFCRVGDVEMNGTYKSFWVKCMNCGALGPDANGRTEAIKLWNEPTDDIDGAEYNEKMLRKDCDRLRKELDEATGIVR